jgi:Domain of unknown function (DUF4331)
MNKLSKKLTMALVVATICASGIYLIAADHADAPAVTGKTSDITDVYAFQSPTTPTNMVLVVNIQGLLAPSATAAAKFDPETMVEINIDNSTTKDNIEDLVIQTTFENGKVQVYGPAKPIQTGLKSTLINASTKVEGAITAYGAAPSITDQNGMKVFAGPRDDPFFFDLTQYKKIIATTATGFNNPGADTFAGTNVMSIVVELPKSVLGTGSVNIWATSNRKM